jgi:hypothetical protein
VTVPPHHSPTLLDISIIHPRYPTYVAAASQERGAAAALRDSSKYRAHADHLQPGDTFVPASVKTYRNVPSCGTFVHYATSRQRALWPSPGGRILLVPTGSVALVQSQGYVYRSCALLLAKASGRQVLPGADTPVLD